MAPRFPLITVTLRREDGVPWDSFVVITHPSTEALNLGIDRVRLSPASAGTVAMIVARPVVDEREVLDVAELVVGEGLAGDNYRARGNSRTEDGQAHPEAQVTLMNAHAVDLCAGGDRGRWSQAGDQFYVDFDLAIDNIPAGTRLQLGTAVIEVSAKPHTGCAKFAERFGIAAARWVNSLPDARLRGNNAMVIEPGTVSTGGKIAKIL